MKKKILPLIILTLIISLINTGMLMFLVFDKTGGSFEISKERPVVISKDYDKGQSMEKALKTGKPLIVWFYTDWCGYCQKFAPTFKKLTTQKEIKKNYAVAYINAEEPENAIYMQEFDVHGYPTVYIINEDKKEQISSAELFQENAVENLKAYFLAFLR